MQMDFTALFGATTSLYSLHTCSIDMNNRETWTRKSARDNAAQSKCKHEALTNFLQGKFKIIWLLGSNLTYLESRNGNEIRLMSPPTISVRIDNAKSLINNARNQQKTIRTKRKSARPITHQMCILLIINIADLEHKRRLQIRDNSIWGTK